MNTVFKYIYIMLILALLITLAVLLSKLVKLAKKAANSQNTIESINERVNSINDSLFNIDANFNRSFPELVMTYGILRAINISFRNNRKNKEVVENIPIESIVTETDCPWLAPTPHRGERNESDYIKLVIDEIARLKGTTVDAISDVLYKNALDVYDICD